MLFYLGERRLKGDLTVLKNSMKGDCSRVTVNLLLQLTSNRARRSCARKGLD